MKNTDEYLELLRRKELVSNQIDYIIEEASFLDKEDRKVFEEEYEMLSKLKNFISKELIKARNRIES